MVAVQNFHTKQKNISNNNYPHFVGQSYETTDCKNNASSLSSFAEPCEKHHPEILVLQATPKNKFSV